MVEIRVNGKLVTLREVGSAMSSRWGKYLPECDCLVVCLYLPFGICTLCPIIFNVDE